MVSSLPTANAGYKVLSVVKFENDDLINHYEVEGRISELNAGIGFKLGASLNVTYEHEKDDNQQILLVGQWVEVEGTMNVNTLDATSVEIENYEDLGNDTEIEGIITAIKKDKSSFELNYQGSFTISDQTRFDGGNKADLKRGSSIEVTSISKDGSQFAAEIEFDDDSQPSTDWKEFEQQGNVKTIDSVTQSFTINNVTIFIDASTEFEDRITFDTLTQQPIEVEGVIINDKNIAREIEYLDN